MELSQVAAIVWALVDIEWNVANVLMFRQNHFGTFLCSARKETERIYVAASQEQVSKWMTHICSSMCFENMIQWSIWNILITSSSKKILIKINYIMMVTIEVIIVSLYMNVIYIICLFFFFNFIFTGEIKNLHRRN